MLSFLSDFFLLAAGTRPAKVVSGLWRFGIIMLEPLAENGFNNLLPQIMAANSGTIFAITMPS
jgi:hypothetical protein